MPILEAILLPSSFELNGPGSIFHLHSLPPNHTTQLDFRPSFLVSFSRWLPGITLPLSTHRIISLPALKRGSLIAFAIAPICFHHVPSSRSEPIHHSQREAQCGM